MVVFEGYRAYLGMGTNLGDRVQNLLDARRSLDVLPQSRSLRCSSLYLSSPVGFTEQPDFINCVLELGFDGSSEHLFAAMQKIESLMGRTRDTDNQNAPRNIDLDLLLFGDMQSQTAELTIPHARMTERLFVIEPLLELNSRLVIPGLGKLSEILQQGRDKGFYDDQALHKLGGNIHE